MGTAVNNMEHWFHFQPATGLFEVKAKRHLGNANINAETTVEDESAWYAIVTSARSDDTDAEFYDVVHGFWPGWAETHLSSGGANLTADYRATVLRIVDPQP